MKRTRRKRVFGAVSRDYLWTSLNELFPIVQAYSNEQETDHRYHNATFSDFGPPPPLVTLGIDDHRPVILSSKFKTLWLSCDFVLVSCLLWVRLKTAFVGAWCAVFVFVHLLTSSYNICALFYTLLVINSQTNSDYPTNMLPLPPGNAR